MGIKEDLRDLLMPLLNQEIPLAVVQTTEALWPREDKRPQIHSKKRLKDGWEFIFILPPGMTFRQFAGHEEAYRDACGDVTTEVIWKNGVAILKIITKHIGGFYEYDFDYERPCEMALPIPIGYTHKGLHIEDLARIPHMLICGVTRSGKSNFIHVMVNSLLNLPVPPKVVIIDLKKLEYRYLEDHVLLVTNKADATMAVLRVAAEMNNRLEILKQARCVNIFKYNAKFAPMQHIVLVIDELAEIDDEYAQRNIEKLAALSAAAGICLVTATQRPDAQTFKHFGRTKGNLLGRLCFRVTDVVNSRIALDNDAATKLPKIKGRAIWKFNEQIEVQVPYLDPEIAEGMLLEQSPIMRGEGLQNNRNTKTMGGDEHRAGLFSLVPFLSGSTEKIATLIRSKKD